MKKKDSKKKTKMIYIVVAICLIGLLSSVVELNVFAYVLIGAACVWALKYGPDWIRKHFGKEEPKEEQKETQK